jgi:hypothetical protein
MACTIPRIFVAEAPGTNPESLSVLHFPSTTPSVLKEKMVVVIAPRRILDLNSLSEALR